MIPTVNYDLFRSKINYFKYFIVIATMPVVYIGMASDLIHDGHINIIRVGRSLGSVCVGLLTDDAIRTYKRQPILSYESRKMVIENIVGVDRVIPQYEHDYRPNLELIRPDYVVHGDDWKIGTQSQVRQQVIEKISEWGGRLIEPAYTTGISTTEIIARCSDRLKKDHRLIMSSVYDNTVLIGTHTDTVAETYPDFKT